MVCLVTCSLLFISAKLRTAWIGDQTRNSKSELNSCVIDPFTHRYCRLVPSQIGPCSISLPWEIASLMTSCSRWPSQVATSALSYGLWIASACSVLVVWHTLALHSFPDEGWYMVVCLWPPLFLKKYYSWPSPVYRICNNDIEDTFHSVVGRSPRWRFWSLSTVFVEYDRPMYWIAIWY